MRNARPALRLISMLMVLGFTLGACSSGDDDSDASADTTATVEESDSAGEEASEPSEDDSDSSGAELSCEEAGEPAALLRGANGWLGQVVSPETEELIAGDYEAVLAAVETLRPIQDIEGIFGTMRQGLDNIEADVIALQEGRYEDKVGEYGTATMNAVIGEEVCG